MREPLRFQLRRIEDESGVSGTGIVAYGVVFASGTTILEWNNEANPDLETSINGLSIKPGDGGLEATEEIHGHGGRTRIEWIDEPEGFEE